MTRNINILLIFFVVLFLFKYNQLAENIIKDNNNHLHYYFCNHIAVDVNAQNEEAVNEIFANTLEKEKTSFKNTTISRTVTDKITNTSKTSSREYYSFIDSNYRYQS